MKLIVAHRVLIGSALALAVLFGIRATVLFLRARIPADGAIAAASFALAGALGAYFARLQRRAREEGRRT